MRLDNSAHFRAVRRVRIRTLGITIAVMAVASAGAYRLDRFYSSTLRAETRDRTKALLAGHASALELAFAKRVSLLESLAAWIRDRPDASPRAFQRFAASLYAFNPRARALQRVSGGRITDTYPLRGNEGVIGYDLFNHPDTAVVSGLRRALAEDRVTVSGPVDLIQGGFGVILRRSAGDPGDGTAHSAALVVDVGALVEEAGVPTLVTDLDVHLATSRDGAGIVYGARDPIATPDPIRIPVRLPEGSWTLMAAPWGGWDAAIASDLRAERAALAIFLILAAFLAYVGLGHHARLELAVATRTAELTLANQRLEAATEELVGREERLSAALTAGRVQTWSWDVRKDPIWRWGRGNSLYDEGEVTPTDTSGPLDRVHPDDRVRFGRAVEDARKTGVLEQEYRVDVGRGEYAWMRVEGTCSASDDEGPLRMVGAVVDISRVKELEAAMLHRGRLELLGQLAGGVVHDLNNVLAVIRAELELSIEDEASFPYANAAASVLATTRYASLLLGQLLTFARKDQAQPTTFGWDEMCKEVVTFLSRLLGSGVTLTLDLEAEGARVHMDRAHAMQVLTNLAANARDAMDRTGRLTLATRTVDDGSLVASGARPQPAVVLEVRDTGPGIPADVQDRIFEAFFTTKGAGRGTGLGLSTTQRIIHESGGDITFRTSSDGTTFIVVVPLEPSVQGVLV